MRLVGFLSVMVLLFASFSRPPDFYWHGCHFFYMGGEGYPLPVPMKGLRGYMIGLESGETLSGNVLLDEYGRVVEHEVRCER
jgi:hypothetical protein